MRGRSTAPEGWSLRCPEGWAVVNRKTVCRIYKRMGGTSHNVCEPQGPLDTDQGGPSQ